MKIKVVSFLNMLKFFSLYFGMFLLVNFVYSLLMNTTTHSLATKTNGLNSLFIQLISGTAFMLFIRTRYLKKGQMFFSNLQIKKISSRDAQYSILLGVLLNIGLVSVMFIMSEVDDFKHMIDAITQGYDKMFNSVPIGMLLFSVGIFLPFIEEIIFRGLVVNELSAGFTLKTVIAIQAMVFSLMHFQLINFIPLLILGLLLGFLRISTSSLTAPILMHASFNLINLLFTSKLHFSLCANFIIMIICATGIMLIIRCFPKMSFTEDTQSFNK